MVDKHLDEDDRKILRAMGLHKDCTLRMCRAGEPCIVAVLGLTGTATGVGDGRQAAAGGSGCRIGLARPLAERIVVQVRPGDGATRATP